MSGSSTRMLERDMVGGPPGQNTLSVVQAVTREQEPEPEHALLQHQHGEAASAQERQEK